MGGKRCDNKETKNERTQQTIIIPCQDLKDHRANKLNRNKLDALEKRLTERCNDGHPRQQNNDLLRA